MDIHTNLQAITSVAISNAKSHGVNYNIILMNPDKDGNFSEQSGSTYEFVRDSYFDNPRPHVVKIADTDTLLKAQQ